MIYSQRVVIRRRGTGTGEQDRATAKWTSGDAGTPVHEGFADVQDVGTSVRRGTDGQQTRRSDAKVFLADEAAAENIKPNDLCTVWWTPERSQQCEVLSVRRLDGSLEVVYL